MAPESEVGFQFSGITTPRLTRIGTDQKADLRQGLPISRKVFAASVPPQKPQVGVVSPVSFPPQHRRLIRGSFLFAHNSWMAHRWLMHPPKIVENQSTSVRNSIRPCFPCHTKLVGGQKIHSPFPIPHSPLITNSGSRSHPDSARGWRVSSRRQFPRAGRFRAGLIRRLGSLYEPLRHRARIVRAGEQAPR